MINMRKFVNRRKYSRFNVKDNVFAVIKPYYNKMGQIIDINKTGLSFQYIDCTEESDDLAESSELMIFLNKGDVYLDGIPVKIASNFDVDDTFYYNSNPKKRIGIQFGELSFNQIVHLEYFILNYANDFIIDRRLNDNRRNGKQRYYVFPEHKSLKWKKERRGLERRQAMDL